MWKTLYALGLALPRIVFTPWREFEVAIPERGLPFVVEGGYEKAATLKPSVKIVPIKGLPHRKRTEELHLHSETQRESEND